MYVCMYLSIYLSIYIYLYIYISISISISIYIYIYIYMSVCKHVNNAIYYEGYNVSYVEEHFLDAIIKIKNWQKEKGTRGVEPRTSRSAVECCTTELYPLMMIICNQCPAVQDL